MPSTALVPRARRIRRQSQNAFSKRTPPVIAPSTPLPRRPEKLIASSAMPLGGTRRFSMPLRVPSQLTLQPRR
jgi:hypothetical protein